LGSLRFEGVRFAIFSKDHPPPHVHGFYAGIEVIVEINEDYVQRARRKDSIRPPNAKSSDVAHIENIAAKYRHELLSMWRKIDVASKR
jgi:hypothetical protein